MEYPARNFVVLSGSIVSKNLARLLAADRMSVKIINKDEALCREMTKSLSGMSIICVDFIDFNV